MAEWFGVGQMPVHRAIELERAGDDAVAATLWQDITARDELHERPYESALAKINYGLCLHRLGHERARLALAEATTAVSALDTDQDGALSRTERGAARSTDGGVTGVDVLLGGAGDDARQNCQDYLDCRG